MEPAWEELETSARDLAGVRLVVHHALQPIAAVGQCLLAKAADDSQQSLSPGPGAWAGATLDGSGIRAALAPVPLEARLIDGTGGVLTALPLEGRTLAEVLGFLADGLRARGVQTGRLRLPEHPDDFPDHPLAHGAAVPPSGERGRRQLAALFADTAALLSRLPGLAGTPARLWPHHFDLACTLAAGPLSVGLGVSPGDGVAGLPYWYVTLWPGPEPASLPPLDGGGSWRREGWSGAELPLSRLATRAAAQSAQLEAFFRSALAAAPDR